MKCHCGVENLPDAQFCARCGAPLSAQPDSGATTKSGSDAPASAVSAPTKPKSRLGLVIGIAVVIVAAVAYWWFNRPEPDYVLEDSGLYEVRVDGKLGFIDKSGTIIIQPAYDSGRSFNEGLVPVRQQGKWGFLDAHGTMVIQPQFDDAYAFVEGLAPVQLGSGSNAQWGFIGKDGKYVINPQFKQVSYFHGGLAPVNVNGEWGFVDKSGAMVIKPRFGSAAAFSEGLAQVNLAGKWGYIDKAGNEVIKPQFESTHPFSERLAQVKSGGKYGYIDREGKFVINPQFDLASSFKHGFAIVRLADQRGTIDKSGKFILNPGQVILIDQFVGDDLIAAKTTDGLGYVDKSGAWVVSPTSILENAEPMQGGIARVKIAGELCYINTSGVVIWGTPKGKSVFMLEKERKEKGQQQQNGCNEVKSMSGTVVEVAHPRAGLVFSINSADGTWGFSDGGDPCEGKSSEKDRREWDQKITRLKVGDQVVVRYFVTSGQAVQTKYGYALDVTRHQQSDQASTASKPDEFGEFYAKFRIAVRGRDRSALQALMSARFQWGLDRRTTRDEAFKNIGQTIGWEKFWTSAANAVAKEANPCKKPLCQNRPGYHTWAEPLDIMFERDSSNQWHWTAVLGD
jgi:hypothetical protein